MGSGGPNLEDGLKFAIGGPSAMVGSVLPEVNLAPDAPRNDTPEVTAEKDAAHRARIRQEIVALDVDETTRAELLAYVDQVDSNPAELTRRVAEVMDPNNPQVADRKKTAERAKLFADIPGLAEQTSGKAKVF